MSGDDKVVYNRDSDGNLISKTYISKNGNSKTYEPYKTPDLLSHFVNTVTGDDDHGPLISSSSSESACCYITSACLDAMSIPWTAPEMKAMKVLTKDHILKSFSGKKGYLTYGKIAPVIVKEINSKPDAKAIWVGVYGTLKQVTQSVVEGKYEKGYQQYKSLVLTLKEKFIK